MPASGRSGRDEYLAAHIPGARFLDIDEVSDRANPAPHMLPSADEFGAAMASSVSAAAIASSSMTIRRCAARRAAGSCSAISAPSGSRSSTAAFNKWLAEGRPTESGEPAPRDARFEAEARDEIVTKAQILAGDSAPLIDARGKGRFEGSEADPRPGVAAGHIPGARNLPFAALYKAMARSSRRTRSGACSPRPESIPRSRSSPLAGRA